MTPEEESRIIEEGLSSVLTSDNHRHEYFVLRGPVALRMSPIIDGFVYWPTCVQPDKLCVLETSEEDRANWATEGDIETAKREAAKHKKYNAGNDCVFLDDESLTKATA